MPDISIVNPAVTAAPKDYKLRGGQELLLIAATANVDGSGAAAAFLPALQMIDPAGNVMWTSVARSIPVAAGGSANVSWFPGGGVDEAGAAGGGNTGTISRITGNDGTITVVTPTGPSTDLALATTAVSAGSYGDSGHVATFTVDADGRLTAASSVSISGGGSVVASDGWVPDANTYTFATATSFTVGSTDLTAVYSKGTRIKLTQTTVKYFVVTSSSFGAGTTTVNISAGTDFTLANAAITATFYSYVANPQGYPGAFNFTPGSIVGWAASPTVSRATFAVLGTWCFIDLRVTGTSNSTSVTMNGPIAGATTADGIGQTVGFVIYADNGTSGTTPGRWLVASGTAAFTVNKDLAGAAWTNAGTKTVAVTGAYRI